MSKNFWIAIAIIIVGVLVIVKLNSHTVKTNTSGKLTSSQTGASPAPSGVVSDLTSVPQTTLDMLGQGTAVNYPKAISAPMLSENGKPEIFYEGAEYCPYCATERWAMALSLSRFGTFTNLQATHSSGSDVFPDTQTLSFYGSTYSSPYITFVPVELYTNIPSDGAYTTLQTPTKQEDQLSNTYDSGGSIPFIDFGGRYVTNGASYNPEVLQGKTANQIAGSLANQNTAVAQGVDGSANTLTAAICKLTDNQPSNVCDSVIQGLENNLK